MGSFSSMEGSQEAQGAPDVLAAESFGLNPGDPGYDTFDTDFPRGDETTPAPVDFQDTVVGGTPDKPLHHHYDLTTSRAWKLRAEGKEAEAEQLLASEGIRSDNFFRDDGK